ncbi:MAG: universal stress protein [Cytophagales bacterium]|jgi:nucleotide-binding universal stress UspA family protein|nr:universal stress protein [Cytophagales bacterium]
MKTILVPTDFSDNARQAFAYAARIAEATQAHLVVLHAYNLIPTDPLTPQAVYTGLAETIAEQAHQSMAAYQEEVRETVNVPVTFETRLGLVTDVVLREAQAIRADLIVMGTHGASGLFGGALGSITSAVIERHVLPVLAVPPNAVFNGLDTIVFGADYHEFRNSLTLKPLTELAQAFDSKIHILNATPVPEKMGGNYTGEEQLERLLRNHRVCFDYTDEADVEKALTQCMKDEKGSLLVLVARQRGFWEGLFHRSVTRSMALHSRTPLLILPDLL